jgi:hypothetical protein
VAREVTLLQLRLDIRNQADLVGTTARHSDELLTRLINQSIQRFRERLCTDGVQHYLTNSTGLLAAGATSPYPFATIDLSAAAPAIVRTYSVDIDVSGYLKRLHHINFDERDRYSGSLITGEPMAWCHLQTELLAVMPAPSEQYSYTVWHLPKLADLADDADEFDGVAGWEDFIVWDVVSRLVVRDQYPQAYGMIEQNKQELWRDILRSARKVTMAPIVGYDALGMRMQNARGGRWRL